MAQFNYTTGNPANLVGGGNASMTDIQGPFVDLRTFLNGGNLAEDNIPNLAAAFTTYKDVVKGHAIITSAASANRYGMFTSSPPNINVLFNAAEAAHSIFYLDPVDFNANSRVTKLMIRLIVVANSASPAVTFTAGLYNVATISGSAPNPPLIATTAAVVSGSTAAAVNPAGLTPSIAVSGDFTCPAAGYYVLNVVVSGAPAGGNRTDLVAQLFVRQV